MVVGFLKVELYLPESRSLKEKRQVIKSLIDRIQRKFNVSIAEIDHYNLWQRTSVGISCVSKTGYQARKLFHQVEKQIESFNNLSILDEHISLFDVEI